MSDWITLKANHLSQIPELEAWRQAFIAADDRRQDFMRSIGADSFYGRDYEAPKRFGFPGRQPYRWTRPRSDGSSRPWVINTRDREALTLLCYPEPLAVAVSRIYGLPTAMMLVKPDGKMLPVSFAQACPFHIDWPDDDKAPVVLYIPNYEAMAEEALKRRPSSTLLWTCMRKGKIEVTAPHIPAGFERITEAEADLIYAEARVKRERLEREAGEAVPQV